MAKERTRQGITGLVAVVAAAVALAAAGPAAATQTTAGLGDDGVLVQPGAEEVDRQALVAAVQTARAAGVALSVAILAADPPGGAEAEADRLVDQAGGVVLVLTPGEVGAVSADHGDRAVDAALDAASPQFGEGGSIPAGVETFGRELAQAGEGGLDTSALPGPLSGISMSTLVIGGIVLLAVLVVLPRLLGGGRRRRRGGIGGMGGMGGYGGHRRRRRGGGGLAGGFLGGMAGGALGGRHRGGTRNTPSRTRSSSTPSRGSSSRSRGSASRSRGSSSRSRGSSSRRR